MSTTLDVQDNHFDTLVVGFGKAGKTLAGLLAKDGRRVALIERDAAMFGGTCINIGCVPTKTLLHDADLRHATGSTTDAAASYAAAIDRKRGLRARMNAANLAIVEDPGALVFVAHATFVGERTVELVAGDERLTLTAEHVVIGTGATPRLPEVPGLPDGPLSDPRILTSTELIDTERLPRRLAVLGAGFIALELANLYREFGSEVTVLNRGPRLLKGDDPETADAVARLLTDTGVRFLHDTALTRVDVPAEASAPLTLHVTTGGTEQALEADALLLSVGRVPNVEGLGLDQAGVEVREGAIVVDDFLRTTAENVWAVGDVNGGPQHTYISYDDHRIVADQLLHGRGEGGRSLADRGHVPTTTFITPPLSRVGLSAGQARALASERGWDVAVARQDVADIAVMPRPKAMNDPRGFIQVVVDRTSGQVLGATLLCIDSQELVNLIALAMNHGIGHAALRDAIYTHPSSTEALNAVLGLV